MYVERHEMDIYENKKAERRAKGVTRHFRARSRTDWEDWRANCRARRGEARGRGEVENDLGAGEEVLTADVERGAHAILQKSYRVGMSGRILVNECSQPTVGFPMLQNV
eukprot:c21910_g2_i1 orf=2-325(-)